MSLVRGALTVLALIGLAWVALVVLAWVAQRQLIYLPDRSAPARPAGVEEVVLTTADGLELSAWFVPTDGEPVSTVLVAPGNAGNRGLRTPLAAGLSQRGHAVLLLDYRGYGGNPGRPHEDGLVADARAAWHHLVAREEVDPGRVVVLGESLGTGVAAAVAAEPGGNVPAPAAVVLRSPFPSLAELGRHHYRFLPVGTLLRDRFPVSDHLDDYAGEVLVVAGGSDAIVPTVLSRQVADRADAAYVEIPGTDHNDPALLDGADYLDAVDAFLRSALP